jgi:hypothetical protein
MRVVASGATAGLSCLLALSLVNSFIVHMTPDISIYLLHTRTFLETMNRFTFSWENKGIVLTFVLALPVRLLGPTVAAAALAQLCAHVVALIFLYSIARLYADRRSSVLLVLVAGCVILSNRVWGGGARPENFALACCTGCVYAGLRGTPKWWAAGGAMVACCLFMKFTLVLAPAAVMIVAVLASAVDERETTSTKRAWAVVRSAASSFVWVVLGFAIVACVTLGWIVVFDDPVQCFRQTILWPVRSRGGHGLQLRSFVNVLGLLDQSGLGFLFAGCIPGLIYGWFNGFRRPVLLIAMLLAAEFIRPGLEQMPYPYLLTIIVAPMLLGAAFFGCARDGGWTSALSWIVPVYLLVPLLIPTAREQWTTFQLRGVQRLPAPYEYLAQQMNGRYRRGEHIFVNDGNQQLLLLLGAPRPFPILYWHFLSVSEEERTRTLKHYEKEPPDWIITKEPDQSPIAVATTLGTPDGPYHVYRATESSGFAKTQTDREDTRSGLSLSVVGLASRRYELAVDTGYMKAWHLIKEGT